MNRKYTFSTVVALNAFLLFLIQPVISKLLLPMFGGSSSVWTTAVLFFQLTLLFGYFYSYLLAKISYKKQAILHLLLVLTVTAFLVWQYSSYRSLVFITGFRLNGTVAFQLLSILTVSIGLPFFVLSTTSVVLQNWLQKKGRDGDTYKLYAFSNLGSLFAIVLYPFVFEPYMTVGNQVRLWIFLFVLCSTAMVVCAAITRKLAKESVLSKTIKIGAKLPKKIVSVWLFLSTLASILLISVTSQISQSVGTFPFLWLLPLGLYLLSFVICFSGEKAYKKSFYIYVCSISLLAIFMVNLSKIAQLSFSATLVVYSVMLFSAFMVCHGELYKKRPETNNLSRFYLFIAMGGVLGGLICTIVAPLIAKSYIEFPVAIISLYFLLVVLLANHKEMVVYRILSKVIKTKTEFYFYAFVVLATIGGINFVATRGTSLKQITSARNFYGVTRIMRKTENNKQIDYLYNGNIIHGLEIANRTRGEDLGAYYGKGSAIEYLFLEKQTPRRVGVIGLGAGMLADYGESGDEFYFYEIDPKIINIAKNNFSYLVNSKANTKIIEGDARLALEKEAINTKREKYDLLLIDAFSDDSIPTHLLTKEAFAIYLDNLRDDGVISVHITNKYIDLKPVLVNIAKQYGLNIRFFASPKSKDYIFHTEWSILSSNELIFKTCKQCEINENASEKSKKNKLWTDDYSNIFQILK